MDLHREVAAQTSFYTQRPLHREAFTQNSFPCAQTVRTGLRTLMPTIYPVRTRPRICARFRLLPPTSCTHVVHPFSLMPTGLLFPTIPSSPLRPHSLKGFTPLPAIPSVCAVCTHPHILAHRPFSPPIAIRSYPVSLRPHRPHASESIPFHPFPCVLTVRRSMQLSSRPARLAHQTRTQALKMLLRERPLVFV